MISSIPLYCLHTVKWFQILLYFVFIQLKDFKCWYLKLIININLNKKDSTILGLSGPVSNGNEEELQILQGSPRGQMAKVLDCSLKVSEFELQLHYYIHFRINNFGERHEHPFSPSFGLNSITAVLPQGWL